MPRKLTQAEVIDKFCLIHKNKYDYSKVEYIRSLSKVRIICKRHGVFEQRPNDHSSGYGCPKCGISKGSKSKILGQEEVVYKFQKTHKNKYDYSKVEYKRYKLKVKIICKTHGVFEQTPSHHIGGRGCPECSGDKKQTSLRLDQTEVIENFRLIHKNKYDYSEVEYRNAVSKVKIICKRHGIFKQTPANHLHGHGCSKCAVAKRAKGLIYSQAEVIDKFCLIHKNKYDYSKVEYIRSLSKVRIICKRHGVFDQTPASHIHGNGCPKCTNQQSKAELEIIAWLRSV